MPAQPRHAQAYLRAVEDFLVLVNTRDVGTLSEIRPLHVAAHVDTLTHSHTPTTVKQRLAAKRALLDWMTAAHGRQPPAVAYFNATSQQVQAVA